jgi:hypothetical protein
MDFVFFLRQTARQKSHHVFGPATTQVREEQEDSCASRHRFPERETIVTQSCAPDVCRQSLTVF